MVSNINLSSSVGGQPPLIETAPFKITQLPPELIQYLIKMLPKKDWDAFAAGHLTLANNVIEVIGNGRLSNSAKDIASERVSVALSEARDFEKSIEVARRIRDPERKNRAILSIIMGLSSTSQWKDRVRLMGEMSEGWAKSVALNQILMFGFRLGAGDVEELIAAVSKFSNLTARDTSLEKVADALRRNDFFEQSIPCIFAITDRVKRLRAFERLAGHLRFTERFMEAGKAKNFALVEDACFWAEKDCFERSGECLGQIRDPNCHTDAVRQVVAASKEVCRTRFFAAEEIKRLVRNELPDECAEKLALLKGLVQDQCLHQGFQSAFDAALQVDDVYQRDASLEEIAEELRHAGKFLGAEDVAVEITNLAQRSRVLGRIADSWATYGNFDEARRVINLISIHHPKKDIVTAGPAVPNF